MRRAWKRYLVACYRAEDAAHSSRIATTPQRHGASPFCGVDQPERRFEGGDITSGIRPQSFKPPPGGAVVFSCSLLHAVSTVKRGNRFAFLPFTL